ncbi:PAS domain S-box protein [Chitinophaga lutea]
MKVPPIDLDTTANEALRTLLGTDLQALPVALYTTDANGYITAFNREAVKLWGREPEPGKDLWCGSFKIYHLDGSPMPLDECPMAVALREGRPVSGQQIIIERPDGQKRAVAPHPRPVFDEDGRLTGAVNMLVDLTEVLASEIALVKRGDDLTGLNNLLKERVEERTRALERSEERYHKMIEEVEDYAILLLNREGIIQNWNKGAERIKGYSESEAVGKHFRIFYLPDDQEKRLPEAVIEKARVEGKAVHEGWRARKDGTAFWGSVVITALHDDEGRVIGFSKVTRDLTERKTAEDNQLKYAASLEYQNSELQQFTYAAAHDMKEPIRKIRFYTSALRDILGELEDARAASFLHRISDASDRMLTLLEDLLAYSRVSSGVATIADEVSLNEVLRDVVANEQETIERLGAMVEVDPLPVVEGIPFQLRQLFDNLLGNALKYHRAGNAPYVRVSSRLESDGWYITVEDNGIGFEPKHGEKIFELFERLHGREEYPGTGIGLALCRRIMQNHRGSISASGRPGKGAAFQLHFPV